MSQISLMSKYLYTILGFNDRPGFGITSNIDTRARQYTSHQGRVAVMPKVWKGPASHINALEKVLKRDKENLLLIESDSGVWETEWMGDDWTIEILIETIENLITERFSMIEVAYKHFNFTD